MKGEERGVVRQQKIFSGWQTEEDLEGEEGWVSILCPSDPSLEGLPPTDTLASLPQAAASSAITSYHYAL